jgi:hypothetical protein
VIRIVPPPRFISADGPAEKRFMVLPSVNWSAAMPMPLAAMTAGLGSRDVLAVADTPLVGIYLVND